MKEKKKNETGLQTNFAAIDANAMNGALIKTESFLSLLYQILIYFFEVSTNNRRIFIPYLFYIFLTNKKIQCRRAREIKQDFGITEADVQSIVAAGFTD